jgi:SAM-dependent methyltransferase
MRVCLVACYDAVAMPVRNPYPYDAAAAVRYDAAVPIEDGEVEFYLEVAQQAKERGLRTLELAAGTGRIAIPLAQAGVPIVGLEISPDMLARARQKSAGLDNVEWVEGDMCDFDLGEEFGLITIPSGSFQLLLETDDQLACLRCVERHLAPSGRLAFELENLDYARTGDWLTGKRGVFLRNPARDFLDPESGRRVLSWGTIEFHPSQQRYTSHGFLEELSDEGEVVARVYGPTMELRYLFRYETEHLLARSGLEVEALYGDFRRSEFRGTSPIMMFVARRATP